MAKPKKSKPAIPDPAKFGAAKENARPEETKPAVEEMSGDESKAQARAFPIVGFGASAGGLEAFEEFLRHMPPDSGMAFVLVQHLDPKHESLLPSLLARATRMRVASVQDGTPVKPNHVYVIPPNVNMQISEGVLRLTPRPHSRTPPMPIDIFFRSLAAELKSQAVGVILSGTASDGTLGLKAIKAEGGITFVQDEKSAKFDGMPRSAVAAGCVDFVRDPEGIAKELYQISRHPYLARLAPELTPESSDVLPRIFTMLRDATKVDFTLYKHGTLRRRVLRRMALHKLEDLNKYVDLLKKNPQEVDALYQDLLINVTGFFRDPGAFEALKQVVYPSYVRNRSPQAPIRIWVPGCSTGEEAYSIAICLVEFLQAQRLSVPVQLFGTDVSEAAIDRARTGMYPESIALDVSPERLQRFFVPVERGYQINAAIRQTCVFATQNLTRDPPFSKLDLISCRNVLIYLGVELQKRILNLFHYALRAGGFLLLGSSETVGACTDLFAPVDKKEKIYSKRAISRRADFNLATAESHFRRAEARKGEAGLDWTAVDLQREADRVLLARYAPAGVLVDEDWKVLHFRGQTGAYLEPSPGEASFNILKMAREGLLLELRSALHNAKKNDAPVRKEGVKVRSNGQFRKINVEVVPIKTPSGKERYYLVLFQEAAREQPQAKEAPALKAAGKKGAEQTRALEEELRATRQYLQSVVESLEATNEELTSANEEIQSSNEELQSTNEELETAKEELQSTNEELNTVNEELQNRNQELTQVNNDLLNLLSSVSIPMLVMGSDFCIRRYTPMAEKLMYLIPTDVGRPITDIKLKVDLPDLKDLLFEVTQTLSPQHREVRDQEGHWYSMWVRPYRTIDNKVDGAVLVLLDIDALKRSLEEARNARDFAEAIVETMREPLLVLDPDLRVRSANRAFYQTFRRSREEVEGRIIYELGMGEWNHPALRALLEAVSTRDTRHQELELEQDFQGLGRRTFSINARRIYREDNNIQLIVMAMEDITERKQAAESRYRRLFEATKDGIVILDAETGRITDVNPHLLELLGYSRSELLAKRFWESGMMQDRAAGEFLFRELQEKGRFYSEDLALESRDGRRVEVEVVANLYQEASRRLVQINFRDVSERKRANEAMRRSEEQLAESQKMDAIGRLAGGVAHDFNNMLTAILGYTELMMYNVGPNELLRQDVVQIQKAAQRAATLTRQLLAFGRKQILQPKVLNLNDSLAAMEDMLRHLAGEKVVVEIAADPNLEYVKVDPVQVEQMIVNLVLNARDAMPQGGKLKIETGNITLDEDFGGAQIPVSPGPYVMLAVSDTGVGMDEETKSHLFEPFFTTKPKGLGTGLGLSTLYGIVKQSGGTVWVHSEPGQGATFKIYLPRTGPPSPEAERQAAPGRTSGGETVLLVEDEEAVRSLVRNILENAGYRVLEAEGGPQALRRVEENQERIDLLLTDVVMPGMSGRELADRLVGLRQNIKVLYMSGHTEEAVVSEGVLNQGLNFIQKPFTPENLKRKIRETLDEDV